MKIGISCCTPYHIFNAINLKVNKYSEELVDIFICNRFNNSEVIYENIKALKLFNKVYYIEDESTSKAKKLGIALYYKSFISEMKYSKDFDKDYDEFYISCYSPFNKSFSVYLKENVHAKICFIEDGTSTYTIKENLDNAGSVKKYIDKFNSNTIDEYLLYKPQLLCVSYGNKVKAMPPILYKHRVLKYLKQIFGIEDYAKLFANKRFIYLDQKFDTGIDYDIQDNLFKTISKNVPNNEIIVKMHPRERLDKYDGVATYQKTIPWELILLLEELSLDNIFITISSTSALANALLFGKKTKVIFLYKLVQYEEKTGDTNFSKYINKAKELEELDIYVPNSVEELVTILKKLKS